MKNIKISEEVKNNVKNRFNELNGIYTKTIDEKGNVISYIARCSCNLNKDYVVVVHHINNKDNADIDKYIAMAECVSKGDRFIKYCKKTNTEIPQNRFDILTENGMKFTNSELYKNKIQLYEEKFLQRIEKYYKVKKNILMFYI